MMSTELDNGIYSKEGGEVQGDSLASGLGSHIDGRCLKSCPSMIVYLSFPRCPVNVRCKQQLLKKSFWINKYLGRNVCSEGKIRSRGLNRYSFYQQVQVLPAGA